MKPRGRVLADSEVAFRLLSGDIVITPIISKDQVGTTVDLRLGSEFVVKKMDRLTHLDPVYFHRLEQSHPETVRGFYDTVKLVDPSKSFVLHPGQFALGSTLEYICLPPNIGGLLEGRSSWAREGLNVHSTAGIIHPGHRGIIVFELLNSGTHPLQLYPGIRVAQLLFYELEVDSQRPYGPVSGAKYGRYVATNFGRPWEDWEFRVLAKQRERRRRDAIASVEADTASEGA